MVAHKILFIPAEVGASPYPCDITYHGPVAFSESCTRHLSYFIEANSDVIDTVITVHSYGQYLLYPYNFDLVTVPENKDLHVSWKKINKRQKLCLFCMDCFYCCKE